MQSASLIAPSSVLAVHDEGLFELDGNAFASSAPGDDWSNLANAQSDEFITDLVDDQSDDTFTGGSTKDDIDTDQWLWKVAKVGQPKNDITHAFAAGYTNASGDAIVYFGLSKYEADGNNFVGFWFLQDQFGPVGDGTPPGSPFSGAHTVGDVLVLANYTNGGAIADFDVLRWVGTGGDANAAGTLEIVASGVPCTGNPDDIACGATNTADEPSPWPYQANGSVGNPPPANTFLPGTFFEGGINLTALGLDSGCFTSFLAETRASQSVDSTLSDFAGGTFSFCAPPEIATQVQQDDADVSSIDMGESVVDVATLSGSKGEVTGTIDFFVCGPETGKPDCSNGGDPIGSNVPLVDGEATSDEFTPDATGWYCFRAEYDPAEGSKYLAVEHTNQSSECFEVLPAQVTIDKTPDGASAAAGDDISFTITWTNEGPGLAKDVVVTDDLPAGDSLDWTITDDDAEVCDIAGAAGSQVLTCTIGDLANGASGSVTVTSATIEADCGPIENTAEIGASNDSDATDNDDDGDITVVCPPDVAVVKVAVPDTAVVAGDDIRFQVTIANNGTGVADGATGSDTLPLGIAWAIEGEPDGWSIASGVLSFGPDDLDPGESHTVTIVGTTDEADCGLVNNTATVDADNEPAEDIGDNTDSASVFVECPDIAIVKTAGQSAGSQVADGGTYTTEVFASNTTYKYVITNTGNVDLVDVTVTDDAGTPGNTADDQVICTVALFEVDDSFDCTWTRTITADTTNIAIAAGTTVGAGAEVSDSDDAIVDVVGAAITIVKTAGASQGSQTADGGTYETEVFPSNVVYKYVVTNTGDVTLQNLTVVDDNGTPGVAGDDFTLTCPQTTLAAGASMTCFATRTVSNDLTNVARATGFTPQQPTVPVTDTDDAKVVVLTPGIELIKTAGNAPNGGTLVTLPGPVTYTYLVRNTGEVTLLGVTIVDDNGTPANAADDFTVCTISIIPVGGQADCTATRTILANTTNVAVASGTTPAGATVEDDDPAVVVVRNPTLTVVKVNNAPLVTVGSVQLPTAKEGETITYTLTYDLTSGPVTNGVITDVLPQGIAYIAGTASNNDEFTFVSFDAATRTLRWTAPNVTKDGSLTYQGFPVAGASELEQPLVNVATIDSEQTQPDDDDSPVFVPEPPLAATATPRITLPPTDALDGRTSQSNPGFSLMLVLLFLAGLALVVGIITPAPARVRRQTRR